MTTVYRWTGREAKLLRGALRLSVRAFAERLGVGARTINKWEARQADITQRPHMQEILDTALAQASDEAKARFSAVTRASVPAHEAAQLAQPSGLLVRGAMLPIVINGHLVLVPIDADTVATSGLGALVDELPEVTAPLGAARDDLNDSTAEDEPARPMPSEDIERGDQPQRDIVVVDRVSSRLDIPQLLLGFGSGAVTVESTGVSDARKVDEMLRRNFSGAIAAITLGMGIDALDVERLAALVDPSSGASTVTKIGAADVEAIEQATSVLRQWQFSSGGGASRAATVAQFQSVLPLLNRASTPAVRERLVVATADLGELAAWVNYDVERHDDARRLFTIALSVARRAETAPATDLTVLLLLAMTHQALHLRRPQEAMGFVQLGYSLVVSRSQSLSAATASCLTDYQAWCHATLGDARACDRALGQAIEHFAGADPAKAAPWMTYLNTAEFAAQQGHAQYTLALATTDATYAARAVPLLQQAVHGFGPAYARSRAINLAGLAGARVLTGDLAAAVHTGHQAVEEITALASPRAYDRLRTLDTVLRPHSTDAAVSEVRGRIHQALAAA